MPTPALRALAPRTVRTFSRCGGLDVEPALADLPAQGYQRFAQPDTPPGQRANLGLERVLRESFPITSPDGALRLVYLRYELGEPALPPEECRRAGRTFGRPLRIFFRMEGPDGSLEQPVTLGEVPGLLPG